MWPAPSTTCSSPCASRLVKLRQRSTEPVGSAEPKSMRKGAVTAPRSAPVGTKPARQPSRVRTARTIARSCRSDGVSRSNATRHARKSSIRPAARLAPWPIAPSWPRSIRSDDGIRTISAPRGDARSRMKRGAGRSAIGPPPSATIRRTRPGSRWASRSAHRSPIDAPTTSTRSRPRASRAPLRIVAATSP